VPLQPAALDLLTALAPVLAGWGRWYLFGAQAVVAYGVPRLSADVDVTLALVPDEPERFARDMRAAGFLLRLADPDFVRRTRVLPFVHQATGMPLDVVLAGSGLEEEFLDRARVVDIGGTAIPTLDIGDLVIAKVLAGRPKESKTRTDSGASTVERWTPSASATRCNCSKRLSARAIFCRSSTPWCAIIAARKRRKDEDDALSTCVRVSRGDRVLVRGGRSRRRAAGSPLSDPPGRRAAGCVEATLRRADRADGSDSRPWLQDR
jgi:hypothetical protein